LRKRWRRTFRTNPPFRADQLKSGDPYELSDGHPVVCLPTGGRGSSANRVGAQVLSTDPDVAEAGVDTGYALSEDTLRAPDVAVGNVPDRPGWVQGVPPLAVEYADTGQDELELRTKIAELLGAGTRWVWVVRLGMPRQVEVHAPGSRWSPAVAGELLEAPGLLRNPVPVQALYDADAANAATLRNLLQRAGYDGPRCGARRGQGRRQSRNPAPSAAPAFWCGAGLGRATHCRRVQQPARRMARRHLRRRGDRGSDWISRLGPQPPAAGYNGSSQGTMATLMAPTIRVSGSPMRMKSARR
jgi:hypothetical protein